MKLAGLAGGIGCGKSTVAARLVARGAISIDVDLISRELQQPGRPVFLAMVERWGDGIVRADGELDRPAVAAITFNDREEMVALMAFTSDAIEEEMEAQVRPLESTDSVVLLEAALLSGSPRLYGMTGLLVVDTPEEIAIARLIRSRGMDESDVRARMANQPSREQRVANADRVIDNRGDADALDAQLDATWTWLRSLPDATFRRRVA